jgi:hypothetical protein
MIELDPPIMLEYAGFGKDELHEMMRAKFPGKKFRIEQVE